MPAGGAIRCNFGDILQAIENKLLANGVVKDVAQVTWAVNDKVPQLTGEWDVLLRARSAKPVPVGGGPIPLDGGSWDFRLQRFVDITIRSSSIKQSGGNNKAWVKEQFTLGDKVINALITEPNFGTWQPTNGTGDLLTTVPVSIVADAPPERLSDDSTWGDYICTLDVHYMPLVIPLGP